jgi:glycosyltransferase involved in cell wall biosynthesis
MSSSASSDLPAADGVPNAAIPGRRLRIVHCLRAPVGGLFRHVRDLAAEQAARGHSVGVICDAAAADSLTRERLAELSGNLALGLKQTPMPRDVGPNDVGAYRAVRQFASSSNADILHGHGAKGGAYARLAARSLRRAGATLASLYTPHGGSLHYRPSTLHGRIYMTLERQLARFTQGIIFESAYAQRTYVDQIGSPACPSRVITNGLTEAEFTIVEPLPEAADFVFVGELRHLKGVDVLIEALARLGGPNAATAVIIGQGSDEVKFQAQAQALGLTDRIRFAGAMPAREAFRRGRCLVMPSRAESLPYVILEAAAAGLPIIATKVGGIPEIVANTDTTLIEPDNAICLADAMRDVLADKDAAQAKAARLRAAAQGRYSVTSMATGVLGFYAECLK